MEVLVLVVVMELKKKTLEPPSNVCSLLSLLNMFTRFEVL